ncbi:MAG: ISNCY family transposase [Elusimicrobiota bacterium]
MRKRFEQQLSIGVIPIHKVKISLKSRDCATDLLAALQSLFIDAECNEKIFNILEDKITKGKKRTGRPGMDLWQIFVLAQFRLCLNISYDRLHYMANNDMLLRKIMGIEKGFGYEPLELEYQNIKDNVALLDEETIKKINDVIVEFGHEVYKKKETAALHLKTDCFAVESNVHFPTDYNLLWDCSRKCLDTVSLFLKKYPKIKGWRKIKDWYRECKGLMRDFGKASGGGGKNKEKRAKELARIYLKKVSVLSDKIKTTRDELPVNDHSDVILLISLERFMALLDKHIDLLERRVLKGEVIPHKEKLFSIFEEYTEWLTKGKLRPNVELGKKVMITTDQYGLITDYEVVDNTADSDLVQPLSERILEKFLVDSWSFDKGFWNKVNKELLRQNVANVIMPKKGKTNQEEKEEESSRSFVRLRNRHSAVESNINELEHRGLDRCPDRGYKNFRKYVGIAVGAYNLRRIGRKLREEAKTALLRAAA